VHVNQAACDATGMPLYDDIGRPMRDTAPGLATTPLADHFESVAQGKGRRSWEINYSDDRFAPTWFRSTLFRLDADHIALVFDNINEEKRMNAQLEERRRALEQSNAHLEQFAYVASHDLQEPLRTLSSFSELLIERYGEHFDERGQRYLRYIGEASTRMQSLVDGLLRFSRVGRQGKAFASHRLGELVAEAQRAVHHAVVREGATVHLDGPMVAVHVDRDQIISVLQNLLTNALRYRSEASPDIHIGWKVSARRVTLTVSDNGVGVPEHQAERIFLMFQRLHGREVEGTGMGLTLARRIARRHGGDLVLRPTDGPGATFELTLPLPESP
jgi:light-regulated signal transduction histidine kinase (bacteriophytochrome)